MKKSNIVTIVALIIAFILMIAMLKLDTNNDDDTIILVNGIVEDIEGNSVPYAEVGFSEIGASDQSFDFEARLTADGEGRFSAIINHDDYPTTGKVGCAVWSSTTWCQQQNISFDGNDEVELTFVLLNNTDVVLPVGPLVIANTLNGSTQVEISTYLNNMEQCRYSIYGSTAISLSTGDVSNLINSSDGSLSYFGVTGFITGKYYGITNESIEIAYYTVGTYSADGYSFTDAVLESEYCDRNAVTADSTVYNLTYGETTTITTYPDQNVTLSDGLVLQMSKGGICSYMNLEVQCAYLNAYRGDTGDYVVDQNTTASIKITPLTSGMHSYQVYVELGYIIHVWEII
ncbi:MAG: hypothetical protein LUQ09_08655 [Methanomassiliicoccales archaeon]|nr:hypothetical protein [Methanomassiliicoccales archaeon]